MRGKKRRDGGRKRKRGTSVCLWSKKTRVRHHNEFYFSPLPCFMLCEDMKVFFLMGVSLGPVSPPVPLPRKKKPQPRPRAILAAIALAPHLAPVPRPRSKQFEVRVCICCIRLVKLLLHYTLLENWHRTLESGRICS